ncbi:brummer [Aphomia sociella]
MNLSFAGCGFLGIYHVGVAVCFKKYAPHLLLGKISGASFGALSACCLLCDLPIGELTSDVLRVVGEARAGSLGPFSPSFNIQNVLLEGMEKYLPQDVHKLVSGKLHISLTRVYDGKNVIVSEFPTREDLLQALLASCFVPVFSGMLPPRFHGIRYMDGGFSDNLPVLDENTITVSPFCGESDICPRDLSSQLFHVNVANTSIELSKQNINRFARILFPPKPEVLSNMCKQGFDDALRFLHRNNMISCTRCLAVQSTFQLQDVLDDNAYEYDPDCEECKTHRQDALVDDLPDTVMTIFQNAIDSANNGLVNWVMRQRAVRYLSVLTLPYRVPIDVMYATFTNYVGVKVEKHAVQYNVVGNVFVLRKKCIRHNNVMTRFVTCTPKMSKSLWSLSWNVLQQLHGFMYSAHDKSEAAAHIYYKLTMDSKKEANEGYQLDRRRASEFRITYSDRPSYDDTDTFEHILNVTSQNDAVLTYYYLDSEYKMKMTEIYDVTEADTDAVQSPNERDLNKQLEFDNDWSAELIADNVLEHIDCERLAKTVNKRAVILTNFMLTNLVEATSQLLSNTTLLTVLQLEGLPLKIPYLNPLCEALLANSSLQHLYLPRCLVGDAGCLAICKAVRCLPNILTLDLSGCDLTVIGAGYIADLIKYQKIHRYSENWTHTLRYRLPELDAMAGLRRITLCGNPQLGDVGVSRLLDVLADDLWIKALDVQNCGLREQTATDALLMMHSNTTMVIFDLRHNPEISSDTLSKLRAALRENDRGMSGQYLWLGNVSGTSSDGRSVKSIASKNGIMKDRMPSNSKNAPTKYTNKTSSVKKEKEYTEVLEEQLQEEISHRQQLEELNLQLVDQMKQLKQQQIRLWANGATSSGSEQSFQASSRSGDLSSSSGSTSSVPIDQNTLSYIQQAFKDIYMFIKNNQCHGQCLHETKRDEGDNECTEVTEPTRLTEVTETEEYANELRINIVPKKAQSTHMKMLENVKMNKSTKSAHLLSDSQRGRENLEMKLEMFERQMGDTKNSHIEESVIEEMIAAQLKQKKNSICDKSSPCSSIVSDSSETLVCSPRRRHINPRDALYSSSDDESS